MMRLVRVVGSTARRGRAVAMIMIAAVTSAALLGAAGGQAPAVASVGHPTGMAAAPGTRLWAARYNGPANGGDFGTAVAVGPHGSMVFVTGRSEGGASGTDYATVGYDAATGTQRWVARYKGPGDSRDAARAIAVSPDGRTVFVTGDSGDYAATVAYAAATGKELWASRYRGPGFHAIATSIAVSPDGRTVVVTGGSNASASGRSRAEWAFATLAYNASTGARVWATRYVGSGGAPYRYWAVGVAVSPDGTKVYVTGTRLGPKTTTVAYDAASGGKLWVSSTCCVPASSMAVSPDGTKVFTASIGESGPLVARDAATGAQLWSSDLVFGPSPLVAVSPGGNKVFLADNSAEGYDAATGARLWLTVLRGTNQALAVSRDGRTLYVCGTIADRAAGTTYLTRAFGTARGSLLWDRRYATIPSAASAASSVAVSPTTGTVYVTGAAAGGASGQDYATVAYQG